MASSSVKLDFPTGVLVVDDEPVVLRIITTVLTGRGLKVTGTSSGEEALSALARERFGCLLADKNLPGIDGIEVMRRARIAQPHCACLMMTAYSSTQSAVEALRLGAVDYLEKPFQDLDLLSQKVEHALKTQQGLFERDRFLEQLWEFEAELEERNRHLATLELLGGVLEVRVKQATEDLTGKCRILEETLQKGHGVDEAVLRHTLAIIEYLDGVQLPEGDSSARGVIARVRRQLEANVAILRPPDPSRSDSGSRS